MKKELQPIYLDGRIEASLDFREQRKLALEAIQKGFKLVFTLDLGLFSTLKKPLSNASQYLSLTLSLKQFKETLFDEFKEDIESVILYLGSLDFADDLILDEEQLLNYKSWLKDKSLDLNSNDYSQDQWLISLYCRDTALAYLHALATDFLDSIPFCIELNAKNVTDPLLFALLTLKEIYQPFQLIVTNHKMQVVDKESPLAILLPPKEIVLKSDYEGIDPLFSFLIEKKLPYRLIPEPLLITEWDLVDTLFVLPNKVTASGKRMLQGFIAAGGTVVTLEGRLNLPNELTFTDFIANQRTKYC